MKIVVTGGQFFADGFAVRRFFLLEEGESRTISYLSDRGCGAAKVCLTEGHIRVLEGRIGVIRWRRGAELYPLPALPPWEARAERTFTLGEKSVRVTVRTCESTVIAVGEHLHPTVTPLRLPKISLIEGQRAPIIDLTAACEAGEYVAMFAWEGSGVRLLLEDCGESILREGNEVRIERHFDDIAKRKVTTRYLWQGDRFDCSREIVCAEDHPFIREEKGRALLEAVRAKDEEAIRALLSPEIGDPSVLSEYFGEILAVRADPFSDDPGVVAAITRTEEGLVATTYGFTSDQSERIENVTTDV